MKSSITALRAITSVYLYKISFWGGVVAAGVFALIGGVIIYLATTDSGWWWLFMLPLVLLAIIAGVVWFALRFATRRLLPRRLEKSERQQIQTFTNSLVTQAASLQISRFTLAFLLAKDALTGKSPQTRFKKIIDDGKSTKTDFEAIRRMFEE